MYKYTGYFSFLHFQYLHLAIISFWFDIAHRQTPLEERIKYINTRTILA